MQILSVFDESHPLVRALVQAGGELIRVGLREIPARPSSDALYLGDVFEQVKRPLALTRLRTVLARARIPYVMWNRDAPWDCAIKPWRRWVARALRPVDLHLAHSLQSVSTFGEPVVYFPNAADTDKYSLGRRSLASLRAPEGYRFDVTFVGTLDPNFSRVRSRVEFLQALSDRLAQLGISCRLFDTSLRSTLTTAEQVEIIQSSRINLSVGAVCDKPVPSWGLPERCFGVAACGGFLLCDHRKHGPETFPSHAWNEYLDLEDCVGKIRAYLADFEAARGRAELLHADVMERHTSQHRAQALLQLAMGWRESRMGLRTEAVSP